MARSTPHFDAAREHLLELNADLTLPSTALLDLGARLELTAQVAQVEALLAIAEALHGVVYVANANAV